MIEIIMFTNLQLLNGSLYINSPDMTLKESSMNKVQCLMNK